MTAIRQRNDRRDDYWIFMAGLAYRAVGGVVSAVGLAVNGRSSSQAVVVVIALVAAAVAGILAATLRPSRLTPLTCVRYWLIADAIVLVALNLWASRQTPGALNEPFAVVFWTHLQGAVAMWWALAGFWAATCVLVGGTALILVMVEVNQATSAGDAPFVALTQVIWLALALLTTAVYRMLLATRSSVALDEGVRAGQQLQRLKHLRDMHDTVLQTLEGIALYASMPQADERQRLDVILTSARSEAARLREGLRRVDDSGHESLDTQLQACVSAFESGGTRADLTILDVGDRPPLAAAVRDAIRDATREALTNVGKHAAAGRVQVRLRWESDRVEVVVEDDGRGFDPHRAVEHFGIPQSIRRRMAEVGGTADIQSSPGVGTRVTLTFGGESSSGPFTGAKRWQRSSLGAGRRGR